MNIKTEITKIHYDKYAGGVLFGILKFCSIFYSIGAEFKNFLYDRRVLLPKKVNAKVISIGNITTGGVGKTPVVCEIAKYLKTNGQNVAIISRGYGGKLSNKNVNVISDGKKIYYDAGFAGDEPYWLAKETNCPVITSKNRYNAAKYAIEQFKTEIIILDDGFQHRKLNRDLDIILTDSVKQFGNKCQLPAGPLREKLNSVKRADKMIVVCKSTDRKDSGNFVNELKSKYKKEVFLCKIKPDKIYNIKTGEILENGSSATALCAIGQPEQFFNFLKDYNITKKIAFDDHHKYIKEDLAKITGNIITTEKDAVKIKEFEFNNVYALKLKTEIDVENLIKY